MRSSLTPSPRRVRSPGRRIVGRSRGRKKEQKWQIFQEASRKHTSDAEVCRRWGIQPHQLRVIRERDKDGSLDAFKKGPGRPKRDPNMVELEQESQRTNKALRELAIENTLLEYGWRVPAVKRVMVEALFPASS